MSAPPIRYATSRDGYDIAYMVSGEGRPLVLMPATQNHIGHYWASPMMRPAFEELAARFRLIQYDGRGQGLSQRGLAPDPSPEDWRLDLEAVVEREHLERFVLFDQHSRGYVSSGYALSHPERVDAVILLNVALARLPNLPLAVDALVLEDWDFTMNALGPILLPWEEASRARQIVRDIWTQADLLRMRKAFGNVNTEAAWRRVRAPTLVLASRTGTYAFGTEPDSRRLAALIPDARLVISDEPGGGFYGTSSPVVPQLIEDFLAGMESQVSRPDEASSLPADRLSPRELEVIRLVAQGKSNQQIASELVISVATVAKHVNSILGKTESRNRAGAAGYAHRHGLL